MIAFSKEFWTDYSGMLFNLITIRERLSTASTMTSIAPQLKGCEPCTRQCQRNKYDNICLLMDQALLRADCRRDHGSPEVGETVDEGMEEL